MESTRIQTITPASVLPTIVNPDGRTWTHDPIPVGGPVVHAGVALDLTLGVASPAQTVGLVVTVFGRLGGWWYRLADVAVESITMSTDTVRVRRSLSWSSDSSWCTDIRADVRVVCTAATTVQGQMRVTALGGPPCGA